MKLPLSGWIGWFHSLSLPSSFIEFDWVCLMAFSLSRGALRLQPPLTHSKESHPNSIFFNCGRAASLAHSKTKVFSWLAPPPTKQNQSNKLKLIWFHLFSWAGQPALAHLRLLIHKTSSINFINFLVLFISALRFARITVIIFFSIRLQQNNSWIVLNCGCLSKKS